MNTVEQMIKWDVYLKGIGYEITKKRYSCPVFRYNLHQVVYLHKELGLLPEGLETGDFCWQYSPNQKCTCGQCL